jgi:hypothetical protein
LELGGALQLEFGRGAVGAAAGSVRTITLRNDGVVDAVARFNLEGGGPGEFTCAALGTLTTLAPGQSQTLSVTFHAAGPGERRATLQLSVVRGGDHHAFHLVGVGMVRDIVADPATLDFGDVNVGASVQRTLTLRNLSASRYR